MPEPAQSTGKNRALELLFRRRRQTVGRPQDIEAPTSPVPTNPTATSLIEAPPSPVATNPIPASHTEVSISAEDALDRDFQDKCRELLLSARQNESYKASIISLKGDDAQCIIDFLEVVRELPILII